MEHKYELTKIILSVLAQCLAKNHFEEVPMNELEDRIVKALINELGWSEGSPDDIENMAVS